MSKDFISGLVLRFVSKVVDCLVYFLYSVFVRKKIFLFLVSNIFCKRWYLRFKILLGGDSCIFC